MSKRDWPRTIIVALFVLLVFGGIVKDVREGEWIRVLVNLLALIGSAILAAYGDNSSPSQSPPSSD